MIETPLARYLRETGQTATGFAARCDCHVSRVSRVANGLERPGWALANRMVVESGRALSLPELGWEAA